MHNITANATHAIIEAKLAINAEDSANVDSIADGLNELLRESVASGFLADYAFYNSDNPSMVKSDNNPEEGDLFDDPSNMNEAMLIEFAREMMYWCAHRASKNRCISESNMNLDSFVKSYLRGNRDYSEAMK